MKTDVVIVGGGISGLYAALKCLHYGMRVIILEKQDRLGGRIRTIHDNGHMFEAGAGRFHENHTLLRQLISYFGLHEQRNTYKHHYVPEQSFHEEESINKVLDYIKSHDIPTEVLQQMPFVTLCHAILGRPLTQKVIQAFGYNAEFELMNAYDAARMFQRDFGGGKAYYSCKEGLGTVVERMAVMVRQMSGMIYLQTQVTNIKKIHTGFKITAQDGMGKIRMYLCHAVVCAIPKASLEELKFFSQDQRNLMNTVVPVSLHRIYGTFPVTKGKTWFSDIPRSTTNTHIRQFIPVNKKNGLAMVSYSDTKDADYWKTYADKGTNVLKKQLLKSLHVTFPDIENIPEPKWLNSYYWPAGVHMWKPGVNSDNIIPQIQQILGPTSSFYIVGEAYAKNQAWIEGALETVEAIFESLYKHVTTSWSQYGGSTPSFDEYFKKNDDGSVRQVSKKELTFIKEMFSDIPWVLLRHPETHRLNIIDLRVWKNFHPGGSEVFTPFLHKDITQKFQSIPYHKDMSGHFKDSVLRALLTYRVAEVA